MLLARVKRISGIVRLRLLVPEFETNSFSDQYVYSGGVCLEIQGEKNVCTNYIPGIISGEFYTYKEINSPNEIINETLLEKINWSNAHKLSVSSMSKQWDYVKFNLLDLSLLKQDLISFPKINKIAGEFSPSKSYSLFGSYNNRFIINETIKTNLVHDSFASQIYYLGEQTESYSGSLIYTICETSGSYYLEVLGFTSNDYDSKSRIVPLEYLEYKDLIINSDTFEYSPTLNDLMQIPIVKVTQYPKFIKNFSNIKKDDIVIIVNGLNIINMEIYNLKYHFKQTLDEYLTYLFQKQNECLLVIVRKGKIIEVKIDIQTFIFNMINPIYMDINDLYSVENKIKFSTDICDSMLQYDVYNKEVVKYLNDPTYKVEKIA